MRWSVAVLEIKKIKRWIDCRHKHKENITKRNMQKSEKDLLECKLEEEVVVQMRQSLCQLN